MSNPVCEDCKFSNWDAQSFVEYKEDTYFGLPLQYIEPQYDFYCSKRNEFFLEDNAPDDTEKCYKFGKNNLLVVTQEVEKEEKRISAHNRKRIEKFNKMLDDRRPCTLEEYDEICKLFLD